MDTASMIEVRRRPAIVQPATRYKVLIDGVVVGKLALAQHLRAPVAPGRHSVQVKVYWMSSKPLVVDVAPGEVASIDVWPDAKHFWREFIKPATFIRAELAA